MKKKMVLLLLAAVMACGLLTGCGDKEDGENDKQTENVDKESEEGDNTIEPSTVKIMCVSTSGDNSMDYILNESDEPRMVQFRKDMEELGITIECEYVDAASLKNVIVTRMASGQDMPDLFAYQQESMASDIIQWGKDGLVYSADELVETYDEDGSIKAFYDAHNAWNLDTADDGKRYWFSYVWDQGKQYNEDTGDIYEGYNSFNLLVRKDWFEKVTGEEFKDVYTLDEFYDICKKIREEDANGNGSQDEVISISTDGFENSVASAFGLHKSYVGYFLDEYVVENNFFKDSFVDYITYMQKFYNDGLLEMGADTSNWGGGTVPSNQCIAYWNYSSVGNESYVVDDPDANYQPIILDVDGDITNGFYQLTDNISATTYYQFFVPTAATNPEGVMRLIDYCTTEYYELLTHWGIEGVDYELVNDGVVKQINSLSGEPNYFLWNALPCPRAMLYVGRTKVYEDSHYESDFAKERDQRCLNIQTDWMQYATKMVDYRYGSTSTEYDEFKENKAATLQTYEQELLVGLINGSKSLDNLEEYRTELESLGALEQVQLLQDRLDAYMK